MAELNSESSPSHMNPILNLFNSVGYGDSNRNDLSVFYKLIGGLSWCISSYNPTTKLDTAEEIEEALKSIGCPYALQATRIEDLDYIAIYPVVQWLVSVMETKQPNNTYVHERKAYVLNELQLLKKRINETSIDSMVLQLASLLKISKALEKQECNFESECDKKRFKLLSEITELKERLINISDNDYLCGYLDHFICDSSGKLKFAKKELASKLRESVLLKRQLGDKPIAEEVVQYEQRFSELDVHIQDRLQRTRKHYATYNALLEIKDLMLKETSLLNSFDSQFQDAIRNPAGRTKLIGSMEAIFLGIHQKLEKVQLGVQAERKTLETLREQYTAATADQRHRASLLKAFEEEHRKNERLKAELVKKESSALEC